MTVVAEASDEDGRVTSVVFLIDGYEVAVDSVAPFTYSWPLHEPVSYSWYPQRRVLGDRTIEAVAIDDHDATGVSRVNVFVEYAYNAPASVDDGWAVSTLVDEGLDSLYINAFMWHIIHHPHTYFRSIVIARNGKLVLEEYFPPIDSSRTNHIQSATKSFAAILVGIGIDLGIIDGVDTPIYEFFPEYSHLRTEEKDAITLEHVLTMTAGLQWNEHSVPYSDPTNDNHRAHIEPSYLEYVLSKPLSYAPGTMYYYNSGCSVILGGVIRNETGMSADSFAEEQLFAPLGITRHRWDALRDGVTGTHGMLHLRARDMAKFGQMLLSGGAWNGTRIVSADWVSAATSGRVEKPGGYAFERYGYQFHVSRASTANGDIDLYAALGGGGQFIVNAPELGLTVVTLGNPDSRVGDLGAQDVTTFELLMQYVLPAIAPASS